MSERAINPIMEAEYESQNWLHVYPQYCHHGELRMVGNAPAFLALAAALTKAAAEGKAQTGAITRDGEGYGILIERTNTTGLGYTALPYTADWCRDLKTDPEP
jgi:hypothetical protein